MARRPKIIKAKKAVPKGARLEGHVHRYEATPQKDGSEYRICIAGGGCRHGYTWRPGDPNP